MLTPVSPPYRPRKRRRTRKAPVAPPPPPVPLDLVSAAYVGAEDPGASLTMVFSRAIDVAAVVLSAILVYDGEQRCQQLDARGGAELLDPVTVRFTLGSTGESVYDGLYFTVEANNGIVAADDGTPWAGTANLNLPYPPPPEG